MILFLYWNSIRNNRLPEVVWQPIDVLILFLDPAIFLNRKKSNLCSMVVEFIIRNITVKTLVVGWSRKFKYQDFQQTDSISYQFFAYRYDFHRKIVISIYVFGPIPLSLILLIILKMAKNGLILAILFKKWKISSLG